MWIAVILIFVVGLFVARTALWDRLVHYPYLASQRASRINDLIVPQLEDGYSTYRIQILPQPIAGQELREIATRNKELGFDAYFVVQPGLNDTIRFIPGLVEEVEGTWLYLLGDGQLPPKPLEDALTFTGEIIYDALNDALTGENTIDPLSLRSRHFDPIYWGKGIFTIPVEMIANWDRNLSGISVLGVAVAGGGSTYQSYLTNKNTALDWSPALLGNVCTYVLVHDRDENPDTPENIDPFPILLWESLQEGHAYCVSEWLAPAPEVIFQVDSPAQINGMAQMGDVIPLTRDLMLYAEVPLPCRLNLLRNGETIISQDDSNSLEFGLMDVGTYRLEAHLYFDGQYQPWIYTNPITIELEK